MRAPIVQRTQSRKYDPGVKPSARGCEESLKASSKWLYLRPCRPIAKFPAYPADGPAPTSPEGYGGNESRPRFRMLLQEMAQRHEKFGGVFDPTVVKRLANIIDDHGTNCFSPVRQINQIIGECRRGYFRNVLMLRYRRHLVLVEIAKTEAIFQRNHFRHLQPRRQVFIIWCPANSLSDHHFSWMVSRYLTSLRFGHGRVARSWQRICLVLLACGSGHPTRHFSAMRGDDCPPIDHIHHFVEGEFAIVGLGNPVLVGRSRLQRVRTCLSPRPSMPWHGMQEISYSIIPR